MDGCTSNVYLSAMIVKDLKMASDFFVKKLGFLLHNEIDFKSPKAERTMFGLPHHLADQTNVKLQIIGPEDNRDGLMDLIELEGIVGENFSANILPANKGILCYRFPVENLANYRKHLILNEVEIHSTFSGLTLVGIGKVNIFSVISPDGVRLEFYENVDST